VLLPDRDGPVRARRFSASITRPIQSGSSNGAGVSPSRRRSTLFSTISCTPSDWSASSCRRPISRRRMGPTRPTEQRRRRARTQRLADELKRVRSRRRSTSRNSAGSIPASFATRATRRAIASFRSASSGNSTSASGRRRRRNASTSSARSRMPSPASSLRKGAPMLPALRDDLVAAYLAAPDA
jgi:hypothetical protein